MRFRLILQNENGDTLDMTTNATGGYIISQIDGLYPPTATIATGTYAGGGGSYLNNAMVEKRNLVLTFQLRGFGIEKRRQQLYRVVKTGEYIKVFYRTATTNVYCSGYVETCSVPNFTTEIEGQVSIVCPDPYWYALDENVITVKSDDATGALAFPTPNAENPFPIGTIDETGTLTFQLENDGDAVGFVLDVGCDVAYTTLINRVELESATTKMVLDAPDSFVFTGGEEIEISTVLRDKYVEVRGGARSLFPYLQDTSTWIELAHGMNTLTLKLYTALGQVKDVYATLTYTTKWLGV